MTAINSDRSACWKPGPLLRSVTSPTPIIPHRTLSTVVSVVKIRACPAMDLAVHGGKRQCSQCQSALRSSAALSYESSKPAQWTVADPRPLAVLTGAWVGPSKIGVRRARRPDYQPASMSGPCRAMRIEPDLPGSVEMQRVPAFTLELKEVGVAGQSDAGIPDPTGVFTSWNPGDDWSEERGPVEVNRWSSHVLAHLLHPRMVAFADRVVIISRLGGLRQLRR